MKLWILCLGLLFVSVTLTKAGNPHGADLDDNDFAEFEDFDEEEEVAGESTPERTQEQAPKVVMSSEATNDADLTEEEDATVEDEEEEFDHLTDEEEFEGFDKEKPLRDKGPGSPPDLKITKVPIHFSTNWDSYYMEMLMLGGLGVYFLNFLAGKSKNSRLANAWLATHKELLEANFTVVGDNGETQEVQSGMFIKESESVYTLWCSGRTCCEGMLVQLKLLKRQDLISVISRFFKPTSDQIIIKVIMEEKEMDSFVFCLANKKVASKMQKDMQDLSFFCPERKNVDKFGIHSTLQMMSEIGEVSASILDRQMVAALNKYEGMIEFLHFSDQYSGPRQQEDTERSKPPESQKVLIFSFNVPGAGKSGEKDIEKMKPLMQMVFHCVDKVKRIRLSRECKLKAEKNRQKMEEGFLKASHAQRQEAAQLRREEKKRVEKERIMNEEDPDKQRKWEERENRREMKKKQAKVKMMKVKAM